MYCIYAIRNDVRGSIRYIGLTNNLSRRQREHKTKFVDCLEFVQGDRDKARKIEYWWICWAHRKK
jgi:predicted GIY-YIG superfamily endonuclease